MPSRRDAHSTRLPDATFRVERVWLWALALCVLVFVAFAPAINGPLIWDDPEFVQNKAVADADGLHEIWTNPQATVDFHPLTYTSLWLEHQLCGGENIPVHRLANMGYHAAAACFLMLLLRRLGFSLNVAWVAAAVWAVHPLQVESVVWIAERKNTLSGMFFFLSLFHLAGAMGLGAPSRIGARRALVAAILAFAAALLSKPATVPLPVVALALAWWKGHLSWRNLLRVLPFFLLALGIGLWSSFMQWQHVGASGADWQYPPLHRTLIASHAVVFYLGKLVFPYPLMQVYPHFDIDPRHALPWIFPALLVAAAALLGLFRRRLGRGPWVAGICSVALLAPTLTFLSYYFMLYSFVADHFAYLAIAAPIVLAVAALSVVPRLRPSILPALASAAILACTVLAFFYASLYRSDAQLWAFNLRHNPNSFIVHINRGVSFLDALPGADSVSAAALEAAARAHFEEAIRLKPNDERGYVRLVVLAFSHNDPEALRDAFTRLERNVPLGGAPGQPLIGGARARAAGGDMNFFLAQIYERRKDYPRAIECYRQNLADHPRNAKSLLGLAQIAAATGHPDEALRLYEQARQIDPSIGPPR